MINETLLKVRNVKKFFRTPGGVLKAIDDISFDVKKGEIVGLIGESGSGKTTVGRCLVRLYEEYSGLVTLDGQLISGKKLSKSRRLFLNQNMQMIFQDPHASLNGQQNIYSILKEPLVVNKIMKQEYKDFFSDWDDVKNNFKYTFLEEARKLELDTINYHVQEAEKFLNEWQEILPKIKFKYRDIENEFNLYFGYLLSHQQREANVVSKMFENNSKLLELYFKHQQEYRNDSILFIEQEIKAAKKHLKELIEKSKISHEFWEKKQQLKTYENEYNEIKTNIKNIVANNKNIVKSYLLEFKNNFQSHLDAANIIVDNIEKYNEQIKHYLLYKRMYEIFKDQKHKIGYLSNEEMEQMISDFKQKRETVASWSELDKNTNDINYSKYAKNLIDNNFFYSFDQYEKTSKKIENILNEKIKDVNQKIESIKLKMQESKDSSSKSKTIEDEIEKAQKTYDDLVKKYELETKEYEISFDKRMDNYRAKIIYAHEKLMQIRNKLESVEAIFEQKHQDFIDGLQDYLLSKSATPKAIHSQVTMYENKVKTKKEALKAFEIEVKNLKKDREKLLHLLGIKRSSLDKKDVKDILIKEKIYNALEEVGLLRQFAWRYPHEFSGGQRQRIVIARALISNPKIIIADEPIASLDVSIQAQVVNILKELCQKKNVSLIFIAHDLSMVEYIADRILIMHLGKIVELGKTEEIYDNPKHPYTINLFKSVPKISNANDKFEASNFELNYLDEQRKDGVYVDFFKMNDEHDIYSTVEQFKEWTKQEPKVSRFTKQKSVLEKIINSNE